MTGLYDGPIIDAHHHLWRYHPATYPWLSDPRLESLRRHMDGATYRAAAGALDIRGSVWVEALACNPLAEAIAAEQVHVSDPTLNNAIVAHVPLHAPDVEARLDALRAAVPHLRGVRDIIAARLDGADLGRDADPFFGPAFEHGLQAVARHDLVFDLLVEATQLRDAARLFRRLPQVRVVIEHAGSPDFAVSGGTALWRDGLTAMARLPQVAIKISALHCRHPDWTDEKLAVHIRTIVDLFGPDRVAFASDYPVHDRTCAFERAFLTFRRSVCHLPTSVQTRLFHDTAVALYRLDRH